MRSSEAVGQIQTFAAMGLAPHVAIPAMLDTLGQMLPMQQAPFFWANADGQITDFYGKDANMQAMESSMHLGRHNSSDDVPTMDRLLTGPRLVNNTELLAQLPGWNHSAFYNDMLIKNNCENSVDFQLRDATGIRGCFAISRGRKERKFQSAELRTVAALVPHFLHAMNAKAGIEAHDVHSGEEPGHIIATHDGDIVSYSSNAEKMILHLHDIPMWGEIILSDRLKRLPHAAMLVMERLRLIQSGQTGRAATIEVPTRWGLFRVSATPMQTAPKMMSDQCVITIQPLSDRRVRRVQRIAGTDLTKAERRVALRMAGYGDGDTIARDLGLQTSSYRQYAKRIYAALGVEGRWDVKRFLDS
jgi:hypothetical protein